MNQPVGRAHHADHRAADQAAQDGAAEQPRQPGTHTEKQLDKERLMTLFQVDQQRISALDTIMMTIRGWTVTLVSAIVGFSLSQHHRSLLPVAMVGTVLFGLLDVGYRRTQLLHAQSRKGRASDRPGGVQTPPGRYRRATAANPALEPISLVDLVLRRRAFPLAAPLDIDLNETVS
jgi:hypothetical protein